MLMTNASKRKRLQGVHVLGLEANKLNGSLPSSWSSFSDLQYVNLASNSFIGSVLATWSNWSQVGDDLLAFAGKHHACSGLLCMQ